MTKYPIGIQTFSKLRLGGYAYVDKTALVWKLANEGAAYFLARPRRFGKSLLLTTLQAYFEGRRELFKGLAIEQLETEWDTFPVLLIDFSNVESGGMDDLEAVFDSILAPLERKYGVTEKAPLAKLRLRALIRAAYEKEQKPVVLLIDEYDKPILRNMERDKDSTAVRDKLKAIYSVVKSEDAYLRFAMLTGVTRFSHVSVFSDLNNLDDISMSKRYASICGITEQELRADFNEGVEDLAVENGMTVEECYAELRRRYDGYHFAWGSVGVYNPFSVFNTLVDCTFDSYWFATGTPSFLLNVMERTRFDLAALAEPVPAADLSSVDSVDCGPMPILFQSGCLTLKDYDPCRRRYVLGYPNEEVREGFIRYLLPHYNAAGKDGADAASRLVGAIRHGDTATIVDTLKLLFDKSGNAMLYEGKSKERDFRNIVYMVFSFLGLYTEAELSTAAGRMDICCQTKDYIYIIELKMDQAADVAIRQIKSHGYADKFLGDARQLIMLGVNFSTATNSICDWQQEKV